MSNKPREFWINLSNVVRPKVYGVNDENPSGIHVIEKSAADELAEALEYALNYFDHLRDNRPQSQVHLWADEAYPKIKRALKRYRGEG